MIDPVSRSRTSGGTECPNLMLCPTYMPGEDLGLHHGIDLPPDSAGLLIPDSVCSDCAMTVNLQRSRHYVVNSKRTHWPEWTCRRHQDRHLCCTVLVRHAVPRHMHRYGIILQPKSDQILEKTTINKTTTTRRSTAKKENRRRQQRQQQHNQQQRQVHEFTTKQHQQSE